MTHRTYVTREKRGLGFPDAYRVIRRAASEALAAEGVDYPCELSVLLTGDEGIRVLNREHRGLDAPTDVLSFPQNELMPGEFDPRACEDDPGSGRLLLGDIALNLGRCAAQADEFGHSFAYELAYLTVHSVLHLLGYDHMDEGSMKRAMRSREKAVMARLAFPENAEEENKE